MLKVFTLAHKITLKDAIIRILPDFNGELHSLNSSKTGKPRAQLQDHPMKQAAV